MRIFILTTLVVIAQTYPLFGQTSNATDGDVIKDLWFFGRRNYEAGVVEEKALNLREAYAKYAKALEYYRHLHAKYPQWNAPSVKARIKLCHTKILSVGEKLGLDNKVVSAEQLLSENKQLKKYAISLRQKLKESEGRALGTGKKIEVLTKQYQSVVERLKGENAELKTKCGELDDELEELRPLKGVGDELAAVKSQLKESLTTMEAVKENNALLKTKVDELETGAAADKTESAELKRLKTENETLRSDLAAAGKTESAELKRLKTENETLRSDLAAAGDGKDAAVKALRVKRDELAAENTRLNATIKTLQEKLDKTAAEAPAQGAVVKELEGKNAELTKSLKAESQKATDLETMVKDLEGRMAEKSAAAEKASAEGKKTLEELMLARKDLDELKKQFAEATAKTVELNKKLGDSEAEVAGLSEELKDKKEKLELLEKLHKATLDENHEFQQKMSKVVGFMHDARSDQRKKASELEEALTRLKTTLADLESERGEVVKNQDEIKTLKGQLESFKVKSGSSEMMLRKELESMAKSKLALSDEKRALEKRLDDALAEVEKRQRAIAALEKRNADLSEKANGLVALKTDVKKSEKAVDEEKKRAETLKAENEKLTSLIKNLNIKYEKVAYLFSAMKKEHDRSQKEIAELKDKLLKASPNGADEMAGKIKTLRGDAEAAVTAKNLLQEELRVLKKSYGKLSENYEGLKKRYDSAKSTIKKSRRDLAEANREKTTSSVSDVVDKEAIIADLSMKNSALYKKYEMSRKRLELQEKEMRSLRRQLDQGKALSEDIQELKLKLAHEKADKLKLEKKLSENE